MLPLCEGVSEPARWNADDVVRRISFRLGIALKDEELETSAPSSRDLSGWKKMAELERISGDKVAARYSSTNALTSLENMCGAIVGSSA